MGEGSIPDKSYEKAVEVIRAGGIVAFPTETYYGLAVDIDSQVGVRALFSVKKRPLSKPILVLIEQQIQLKEIVQSIPQVYGRLMQCFWPGPLTLIFPARKDRLSLLTGESGTIGVRMSPHPVAMELCRKLGKPITATSANISGMAPARNADMVREMFGDNIDYILDGGQTPGSESSTIVGIEAGKLVLVRSGPIDFTRILEINHVLGEHDK